MSRITSLIIIIAVSLLFTRPLLQPGFPSTHDGQNHLARLANYYLGLKQGQIPPRWAPNLDNGFGYPALNFNYPLANIMGLPLIAANASVEVALKSLFILGLITSGVGMYVFLSKHTSEFAALAGALIYLTTPYQLSNLFIRGNIGETLSFALLPIVLWSIDVSMQTLHRRQMSWYSLILGAFLLTHNLLSLLSLPFIALYAFTQHPPQKIRRLIKPTIIGVLLTAFFWIPALIEKQYTVLDQSPLHGDNYTYHFPTLSQLVSSGWDFGLSFVGPVDQMSFRVGLFNLLVIAIALIWVLRQRFQNRLINIFTLVFIISFSIMLPASGWLWDTLPALRYIQFPWRFLFFTTISSAIVTGLIFERFKAKIPIVILLGLVIILRLPTARATGINQQSDDYWFNFPLNTTILNEADPVWFQRTKAFELFALQPTHGKIWTQSDTVEVQYHSWTGTKHHYTISTTEPTTVVERTMYFPGWEVQIDDQPTPIKDQVQQNFGLVSFELPAGNHAINSRFTQKTPARLLGNSLTLIGIGLLITSRTKPKPKS